MWREPGTYHERDLLPAQVIEAGCVVGMVQRLAVKSVPLPT